MSSILIAASDPKTLLTRLEQVFAVTALGPTIRVHPAPTAAVPSCSPATRPVTAAEVVPNIRPVGSD